MKPIDIFITAYLRPSLTGETIRYLKTRTKYPYRLFLINNDGRNGVGGNSQFEDDVDYMITMSKNMGIHAAWNTALALAESDYFITTDNDIYVPDLFVSHEGYPISPNYEPDWLERMVKFMDERPDYGAISLHPHILIGDVSFDPNDPEDVKEVGHCGAVMRIMRREAVQKTSGWEHKIEAGRNHEEKWICGKLKELGYKVGRTTRLRAYHPFGRTNVDSEGKVIGNWGYPKEITPAMQGHNPDLAEYVLQFDQPDAYDSNTWLPKI